MASRKALLLKLLETMVDEWGASDVQAALTQVLASSNLEEQADKRPEIRAAQKRRVNAVGQVQQLETNEDRRELLLSLAERFDRKKFLPGLADVREFIIMTGERPPTIKDRSEAFRFILRYFVRIPVEYLHKIAQSSSYSGPAQLGPISDAISVAGERLPRRTKEAEAS